MLTSERAQDIFDRLRKFADASAGELEVNIAGICSSLTRFANNTIHQNVSEQGTTVNVRLAFDGKTASASTNKLDDESLRRALQAAKALCQVQKTDPDLLPMLSQAEASDLGRGKIAPKRYFEATAATGPQERATAVEKMVAVAKRQRQIAAGVFSISENAEAILNSRGLRQFHRQSIAEVSITMTGEDSSGWQKRNSPNVADLRPEAIAEDAARRSVQSAHPRELKPGKYTVILEPSAVLDTIGGMFFDFGALSVIEQRSFLNNRIGRRLFGENISIRDNAYNPLQAGELFDGEGTPRQEVQLVSNGVIRDLVYARASVPKMQRSALAPSVGNVRVTGHGFPLPNEIGDAPIQIVFDPPQNPMTVDQMVAATDHGILVTRVWYIREVDPYEKIVTGMTRDGTFLIENGRLAGGIRNFRFNQSLIELLNGVEAMSLPVRASGEEAFDMVVPAMKVRNFNFTEVTKF